MKERPILFSSEMVRAILDDRKTQTRRVVKNLEYFEGEYYLTQKNGKVVDWHCFAQAGGGLNWQQDFPIWNLCPYGKPGDRFWVRENYQLWDVTWDDYHGAYEIGYPLKKIPKTKPEFRVSIDYQVDGIGDGPWRPSIHMPRWVSRILLEITDVRLEQLQDISHADVFSEGLAGLRIVPNEYYAMPGPQGVFAHLWDSLNANRGFGWDANPWVWVIDFKRVEDA